MVLLAMLALLMMQIELGSKADLLTVQDIKEILEIMPEKGTKLRKTAQLNALVRALGQSMVVEACQAPAAASAEAPKERLIL